MPPTLHTTHPTHTTHASMPPRKHATHANTSPTPPTLKRHSRKHVTHATHASTNSAPFLKLENFKRLSNKTKREFINLDLLNRNFNNIVTIRKNQELAYMILFNDNEVDEIVANHKQL